MNEYNTHPTYFFGTMVGRYSRDPGTTINYSNYDSSLQHKHSNGGAKEHSPCVKSYRAIETTIILDSKAMKELKNIAYYQNKPNQTFSDLIVFLIKQYRIIQASNDPVTRRLYEIHQDD